MKKNLMSISALSLMSLAVFISCAKNELEPEAPFGVDPSQISFRASTGKTKANDNTILELQNDVKGFNVIAMHKEATTAVLLPGFTDLNSDKVTYVFKQGWDWMNLIEKENKLWPVTTDATNYPVRFISAYPIRTDFTLSKQELPSTEAVITNVTLNAGDMYNTYHKGVQNALDSTKVSIDRLGAHTLCAERPATGMADLQFKHIMSNMRFVLDLPKGFKAYVQSIKVVNVYGQGRTYDYKTQKWGVEPTYVDATQLASYSHFSTFKGAVPTSGEPRMLVGAVDGAAARIPQVVEGFTYAMANDVVTNKGNGLVLMPQKTVAAWTFGAKDGTTANSFRKDAKAWKQASADQTIVSAQDITRWYQSAPAAKGLMGSLGWKGARIELTYVLINDKGVALVGRKAGIQNETKDKYVRVGFPLDIAKIGTDKGWEAGKRYTFSIPLGTDNATGGIVLDPVYIGKDGETTTDPIDNPKVNPGDPVVDPTRPIQFVVSVEEWSDTPGSLGETTF